MTFPSTLLTPPPPPGAVHPVCFMENVWKIHPRRHGAVGYTGGFRRVFALKGLFSSPWGSQVHRNTVTTRTSSFPNQVTFHYCLGTNQEFLIYQVQRLHGFNSVLRLCLFKDKLTFLLLTVWSNATLCFFFFCLKRLFIYSKKLKSNNCKSRQVSIFVL